MDTIDELILKAMPNGFIVRGTHSYTDLKQAIEAYIAEREEKIAQMVKMKVIAHANPMFNEPQVTIAIEQFADDVIDHLSKKGTE